MKSRIGLAVYVVTLLIVVALAYSVASSFFGARKAEREAARAAAQGKTIAAPKPQVDIKPATNP